MVKCPECAGSMKWVRPRYTCKRCGLSLTRSEVDELREKLRDQVKREKTKPFEKEKRRKEYLDWYLSSKDKK